MLIVVEGLDGAGKSTQVRKLRNYLEALPQPLEYIHFPRYDSPVYGELISEFLRGEFGENDRVHPKLVALLYAEDRHAAAPQLHECLKKGCNVLLDRYVYSNIAYQCAKVRNERDREALREWIFDTEYRQFKLPEPDLNIFLDVPIEFVSERLSAERKGGDRDYLEGARDIHEADIEFQKRVREVYRRQCELDPKFIRIDCSGEFGEMLQADEVFSLIRPELEKRLKSLNASGQAEIQVTGDEQTL